MRKANVIRPLLATQKDIELSAEDIRSRLEKWRDLQAVHMRSIQAVSVTDQEAQESTAVEYEALHLPSSFSVEDRKLMLLEELGAEEFQLREGQVIECILQLRRLEKRLSALRDVKRKDRPGQATGTRSTNLRNSLEANQHTLLHIYNSGRQALSSLATNPSSQVGVEAKYPPLSMLDLFRKPTSHKRQLGDSKRLDGRVWVAGASNREEVPPLNHPLSAPYIPSRSAPDIHSLNSAAPKHSVIPMDEVQGGDVAQTDAGKLWGPKLGLTDTEAEQWDLEGKHL